MPAIENSLFRPLRLGEILDRAIRLYRRHFLQLLAIVALVQIPITLLQLAGSLVAGNSLANFPLFDPTAPGNPFFFDDLFGPQQVLGSSLNSLSNVLSFFLVNGIASAVLTRVLGLSYLGETISGISEAYRRTKHDFFPIVIALIVYFILAVLLALWWFLIPCLGWITGGGMLIFLSSVILPLLLPVVVLEGQSASNAWRRAWDIGRRRFWWLIGFSIILSIFTFLVVGAPSVIIAAASQAFLTDPFAPFDNLAFTVQVIAQSFVTLFGVLLLVPLRTACYTIAYFDLRVRQEGLDLTLQLLTEAEASTAGERETDLPITSTMETGKLPAGWIDKLRQTAPNTGRGQLITWGEMSRFALITLGIIGIVVAIYAVLFALVLITVGPSLSQF